MYSPVHKVAGREARTISTTRELRLTNGRRDGDSGSTMIRQPATVASETHPGVAGFYTPVAGGIDGASCVVVPEIPRSGCYDGAPRTVPGSSPTWYLGQEAPYYIT